MNIDEEYAKFIAFAEEYVGCPVSQMRYAGVWGIGKDEFAFACWMKSKKED